MSALPSSLSLRNPGKPVQTTRKRKTGQTDAQKATRLLAAAANKRAADALRDAVNDARDAQERAICDIARDHKKKESYVRALLTNASTYKKKRKVNLYNAILHDRSVKAQEGTYVTLS